MPEERPQELYFHRVLNAYECLGCAEMIELPRAAWLMVDGVVQRILVRGNPENLVLWLEMHTLDHAACHKFKDAAAAKSFREYRKKVSHPAKKR